MDGKTNGQKDKWTERQMDRKTNGQKDKWTERQMDRRRNEQKDSRIDRETYIVRKMDTWPDREINVAYKGDSKKLFQQGCDA
jgi:hypothetical protein